MDNRRREGSVWKARGLADAPMGGPFPSAPEFGVGLPQPVPATPADRKDQDSTVKLLFSILLIITSLMLILLILLHKGKGGGLSDMFGGGVSASMGGSTVAERNLDRLTVAIGIVWGASIIGLGLIA